MDAKQRAIEMDADGKCIVCTVETDNRTRGLCTTDYSRFLGAKGLLPQEKRDAFERKMIERGQVLVSKQGQRGGTKDNVFAAAVAEFLRNDEPMPETQSQEQIDAAIAEADAAEARKQAALKRARKKKPGKNTTR